MRPLLISALLLSATPAFAQQICVVDLQQAVAETNEGKAAQKKLDSMFASRRQSLERMEADLKKAYQDYEARRDVLSDTARQQEERKLLTQQQQLNQTAASAEGEMQKTYMSLLGDLDKKLRSIADETGKSAGCSVVLDRAAVIYTAPGIKDVTSTLVAKYNAKYP